MVTLADLQEFLRRSGLNDREAACAASAAQVALQQKREAAENTCDGNLSAIQNHLKKRS